MTGPGPAPGPRSDHPPPGADELPDPLAGYEDWPAWVRSRPRRRTGDALADGLADVLGIATPTGSAPAVRTLDEHVDDGVVVTRVEWHVGFGPPTRAWVLRPDTSAVLPGALALHCHGDVKSVGAEQMVRLGPGSSPQATLLQREFYGGRAPAVELARRGFVVLAHDAFAWGSRRFPLQQRTDKLARTAAALDASWREQGLDPHPHVRYDALAGYHEDTVAKAAAVLGTSLTGTVLHDDLVALGVLAALPGVDPERLGAFGFSGGGGRSLLLAALDHRVRAHVVTCMMATFDSLFPHHLDAHSWLLWGPGLPGFTDWPELLVPRPGRSALVQYAMHDELFPEHGIRAAHELLTARYAAARAGPGTAAGHGTDADPRANANAGAEPRATARPEVASYRAAFWDRPHVFDAAMQDEAFDFLAGELDGVAATG